MGTCVHCSRSSPLISRALGLCPDCLRKDSQHPRPLAQEVHRRARQPFGLPPCPPQAPGGARCQLCANQCSLAEGEISFCGLRANTGGRLTGASTQAGNLAWYYDPLPTNCVADWVCPGGTGCGYPRFAHRRGPEYGYKNLAVFYQACSFDCLFCQNWHFREAVRSGARYSAAHLAAQVDEATACICYFGGDPTPQLPHAIRASRLALARDPDRILRICWETNGSMHPAFLRQMVELSLTSGGCLKFDLKAWDDSLHQALCEVSNRRTLENFRLAAWLTRGRPTPPPLVASTLLVPGYVDSREVSLIARFIASLDATIPYSLLAFCPQFYMGDLPTTSDSHAQECLEAARAEGLRRVRLGNVHLLGPDYPVS